MLNSARWKQKHGYVRTLKKYYDAEDLCNIAVYNFSHDRRSILVTIRAPVVELMLHGSVDDDIDKCV